MNLQDMRNRVLASVPPDVTLLMTSSPKEAAVSLGLRVESLPGNPPTRAGGGMCDGVSFLQHGVILYKRTVNSRRENFTIAHEVVHHLVEQTPGVFSWLADRDEPTHELEELCDEIAGALLLPGPLVNQVIGTDPVRARHIVELFKASMASQVVCAKVVAQRLPCDGAVVLVDRSTSVVAHSTRVGSLPAFPTQGQSVPAAHPLLLIASGDEVTKRSYWSTPWGSQEPIYLDATATAKRSYGILAKLDIWNCEKFHPPTTSDFKPATPSSSFNCRCGYSGTAINWPCETCGKHFCPRCKECDCARRDARMVLCKGCFTQNPAVDMLDGRCSVCR